MRHLLLLTMIAACGDDGSTSVDGGGGDGAISDAPTSMCNRMPSAADRTRYVVVARPYDAGGTAANMYEVLSLTADGTLAQMAPPKLFSLGGRASSGTIPFTPDGKVGFVAFNEGGNIGVFSLDADGNPTVIHDGWNGAGYPGAVTVGPGGDTLYIVDRNTRNNGGGIYAATINCDGTLVDRGLLAAARSPVGIAFRGSTAVIGARDLLDHQVLGDEVHLANLSTTPATRVAGGDAFGDDDQVMGQFALSADGATVFVGDGNFTGVNRVGIATITDSSVAFAATLTDISDPGGLAVSPFGDVALVSAAQGNAIFKLDKGGTNGAWRKTALALGANPQIPADMVSLDRGMLRGHVWISENTSVRQVRFTQAGDVENVGSLAFGSGLQNIPGAIGITP
ncbi:MAG: hypothetical protein ACKV2T_29950 [Kofleriaceae bacterium]